MLFLFEGLEDVNDVGGDLNTERFSFVDSSETDRSFFQVPAVFPWLLSNPDDFSDAENAIEYVL